MADMPDRPSLRTRISARLFGGASGGVFRGMVTLTLGSGIGRIIGIASIPVLTRLYSPEDFGVLAVFTALVAIIVPLVTLRYVLALPLPRHDGLALNLLILSTGLMFALSALFALALWGWGGALLGLVSMEVLAPWWWLIALAVLGTAAYELLTMWAMRRRAYKVIAQTNVVQQAAGAAVKIGLGLATLQPLGLLIGQVVTQVAGSGRLWRGFAPEFRANWHHLRLARMQKLAWRYASFPVYRLPSQVLLVLSTQAPIFLVSFFFSADETGQLALAMMAVAVPVALISDSTAKAFYAEAARAFRAQQNIRRLAVSVAKRSFAISLVPATGAALLSAPLFPLIFGADWVLAGILAALLGLAMPAQFVSQIILKALPIVGRNDLFFYFNLSRALMTFASIAIPAMLGYEVIICIFAYVVTVSLQRIGQVIWSLRVLDLAQKPGVF